MLQAPDPDDIPRVDAHDVDQQINAGLPLHLVCAYDDEEKCRQNALDGSVSLAEFERDLARVDRNEPLVFYCA